MTSQYRFADDFPYIRVKQVGLRMNSQDHQGHTIIASDGHTAAHVIWNTRADPFVTFSAGGHSRTYFITWDQTTLGWRPYLIGDDDRRALKVFIIPGEGFCTRSEGNLQCRSSWISPKNRLKLMQDKLTKKLQEYEGRWPGFVRGETLRNRLDWVNKAIKQS
jgi:hypothetical protein